MVVYIKDKPKKMVVEEARKCKCMFCQSILEYDIPPLIKDFKDTTSQAFRCNKCGVAFTVWNLQVTDAFEVGMKEKEEAIKRSISSVG